MTELTWETMEQHGIDTLRVRDIRMPLPSPKSWVVDAANLKSKLYFGGIISDDGNAITDYGTLLYQQGDYVRSAHRQPIVWWETPEKMLTYVADWMQKH